MELVKLAVIFLVIIILINFKVRLNIAVAVGAVLGAILYQMGFVHSFEVAWRACGTQTPSLSSSSPISSPSSSG